MKKVSLLILSFCLFSMFLPAIAETYQGCTLIVSYPEKKIIKKEGDCEQRRSPCSSFKIALALMGYDSHILVDQHRPLWPYKKGYFVAAPSHEQATNPTLWEKNSVVWYSQKLTRKLGMKKFQAYVNQFNYGNKDLLGDDSKNNGLTHAWLDSSLKISPSEQVGFILNFLSENLGLSKRAYEMTRDILPEFITKNNWIVKGKSGSGWITTVNGSIDKNHPQGWFVGWAEKDNKKIIFAEFVIENHSSEIPGGTVAKEKLLNELSTL